MKVNIPCPAGSYVWFISDKEKKFHPKIHEGIVEKITFTAKRGYVYVIETENGIYKGKGGVFSISSFGETIFTSRNEAEEALL